MKMKQEHFDHMKKVIDEYLASSDAKALIKRCKALGGSKECFQWCVLHSSGLTPFSCKELYPYLNDTHIQTALNKIIKEY